MCGFAVIIASREARDNELLHFIDKDLYHRGPDSGDILIDKNFTLVFRRLAIIDPKENSDQPMTDETGQFSIVFNGEIYNYKELKVALQKLGVSFRTESDTEVLLRGFIEWGSELFKKLEGMYATVIIDRGIGKAFVARDPFGIKPLYRTSCGPGVAFSSEIRPLRRLVGTKPDLNSLGELLSFRFASGKQSNLEGIEKVPAGTLLTIRLEDGSIENSEQRNILDTIKPDKKIDEKTALELIEAGLVESVEKHLQSDVGYTVQLSGGVDSGLISALAARAATNRIKSFAVKLSDPTYDEGNWRRKIIDLYDLDHEEVELTDIDFADALPSAIASMEGPIAHFGCVMLKLLCKEISEYGKVVLTGEGADELFGGYDRYAKWKILRSRGLIGSAVPSFAWPFLSRYEGYKRFSDRDAAIWSSCYHNYLEVEKLFPDITFGVGIRKNNIQSLSDFRNRMLSSDQTVYLESLLMRQDKMAMAESVEARVPFCDLKLAKIVNTIPHELRIPGNETKPLLKKVAVKYLPRSLVYRRKVGLNLPINSWLNNAEGFGRYLELLAAPDCRLAEFGDRKGLQNLVFQFRSGLYKAGSILPILINVELWLRSLDDYS